MVNKIKNDILYITDCIYKVFNNEEFSDAAVNTINDCVERIHNLNNSDMFPIPENEFHAIAEIKVIDELLQDVCTAFSLLSNNLIDNYEKGVNEGEISQKIFYAILSVIGYLDEVRNRINNILPIEKQSEFLYNVGNDDMEKEYVGKEGLTFDDEIEFDENNLLHQQLKSILDSKERAQEILRLYGNREKVAEWIAETNPKLHPNIKKKFAQLLFELGLIEEKDIYSNIYKWFKRKKN